MKRDQKTTRVKELTDVFTPAGTFYLFNYNKMSVAQATALRRTLRKHGAALKVVKNRLALRALPADLPGDLKAAFRKPTAVAYTGADPITVAKALKDFAAQNKVLVMKGGVVQGIAFAPERFDEITKLGSREALLGRIGAMMASPLTTLLRTMQAPLSSWGGLMRQLKDKKPQSE
jgi:large subunit ribosomal protein L10